MSAPGAEHLCTWETWNLNLGTADIPEPGWQLGQKFYPDHTLTSLELLHRLTLAHPTAESTGIRE
jgi:hypothetical protein